MNILKKFIRTQRHNDDELDVLELIGISTNRGNYGNIIFDMPNAEHETEEDFLPALPKFHDREYAEILVMRGLAAKLEDVYTPLTDEKRAWLAGRPASLKKMVYDNECDCGFEDLRLPQKKK